MGLVEDEEKRQQKEFEATARDEEPRFRKYKRINRFLLIIVILGAAIIAGDFYYRAKSPDLFPDNPDDRTALIQRWTDEKFILTINKNDASCVVDEEQWQRYDKDSKLDILLFLAEYCRPDTLTAAKMMIIQSSSGGKLLASINSEDVEIH
jgi:hypothetical protein